VLLGLCRAIRYRRLRPLERWSVAYAGTVGALMTVNHNHQARYVFLVAPFVWSLAVTALEPLRRRLIARLPLTARAAGGTALLACAAGLVGPAWAGAVGRQRALEAVDAARLGPALEFLRDRAPRAERVAIAGAFNELSPPLIPSEFQAVRRERLPEGAPDFDLNRRPPKGPAAALRDWMARHPGGHEIVVIELLPGSPYRGGDYERWNAPNTWVARLLRETGTHVLAEERTIPDAGIRFLVWSNGAPR
jgi:hypothetical protein